MTDQWTTMTIPTSLVLALLGAILEAGDAASPNTCPSWEDEVRAGTPRPLGPGDDMVNLYLTRAERYLRLAGERYAEER